MMAADSFTAQNQIKEFNPDSTTYSSREPVIEFDTSLPDTTSKEGDVQDRKAAKANQLLSRWRPQEEVQHVGSLPTWTLAKRGLRH